MDPPDVAQATGDMSQGERETQPAELQPGFELAPLVVVRTQSVTVQFDGIQDALEARTVPVTGDLTTQDFDLVEIFFTFTKMVTRQLNLAANPIFHTRIFQQIRANFTLQPPHLQGFLRDIDEPLVQIFVHIAQHMGDIRGGRRQIAVGGVRVGALVADEVLDSVRD